MVDHISLPLLSLSFGLKVLIIVVSVLLDYLLVDVPDLLVHLLLVLLVVVHNVLEIVLQVHLLLHTMLLFKVL